MVKNHEIAKFNTFRVLRLKTQYFDTELLCQKPMLQIECGVQNKPIAKSGA